MFREILIAVISAIVVVVAFLLIDSHPIQPALTPYERIGADLDRPVREITRLRGPLRDALTRLRAAGARFDIKWDQLDEATPVDIALRDATLRQWLAAIQFQATHWRMSYWVNAEGHVIVSNARAEYPPPITRVYDIRDLIDTSCQFTRTFPEVPVDPNAIPPPDKRWDAAWSLMDALESHARPETWQPRGAGGAYTGTGYGSMSSIADRLIVTHSPATQRRIETLLAALRAPQHVVRRGGSTQ